MQAHWRESTAGKDVWGRTKVHELASMDARAALKVARAIGHAWYRCQALAALAQANPSHPQAKSWVIEALDAAYSQSEPNRVASVALWPLRILVRTDIASASAHTKRLLGVIAQEAHGLRRLDGLRAILIAVASDPCLREEALRPFLATATKSTGWRTERIIGAVASVLADFDVEASKALLQSRPPTRFTRNSRAQLDKLLCSATMRAPDADQASASHSCPAPMP